MQHFVYIWMDKQRKMFYIGSHSGFLTDEYISSSRWLSGEIRYRPSDFKRRIIKLCATRQEAIELEYRLLSKILEVEFGTRYYNLKTGRRKGCTAWNKGIPHKNKGVAMPHLRGRKTWNKGLKTNKPAWNRGVPMSEDDKLRISEQNKGREPWNKGGHNPHAAENGKKGAVKLAQTVTGRRRKYREDGTWFWMYPENVVVDSVSELNHQNSVELTD